LGGLEKISRLFIVFCAPKMSTNASDLLPWKRKFNLFKRRKIKMNLYFMFRKNMGDKNQR
jgi:hypothetical protein